MSMPAVHTLNGIAPPKQAVPWVVRVGSAYYGPFREGNAWEYGGTQLGGAHDWEVLRVRDVPAGRPIVEPPGRWTGR